MSWILHFASSDCFSKWNISFISKNRNKIDLDQLPWVCYIQLHSFILSQSGDLVKIHLFAQKAVLHLFLKHFSTFSPAGTVLFMTLAPSKNLAMSSGNWLFVSSWPGPSSSSVLPKASSLPERWSGSLQPFPTLYSSSFWSVVSLFQEHGMASSFLLHLILKS